ncbi:unnamed protein product [Schistosoma margrebowiei]|uniref:Uncharacterized protein n=1 Tax=Schistosoma margrebowiei TaxID=48269 RepID=A0A183N1L1_9TREM|nr:unnamed protein product [Schistosoma margrebowiei]
MNQLALVCREKDVGCARSTCTDSEECVSVTRAVIGRVKHPTVIDGKVKSRLKLTRSEAPLDIDIGSHASPVETEDPDKTITVRNSSGIADLSDEK